MNIPVEFFHLVDRLSVHYIRLDRLSKYLRYSSIKLFEKSSQSNKLLSLKSGLCW